MPADETPRFLYLYNLHKTDSTMVPANTLLLGSYDYRLVALSVVIATFASNAALDLAGRVTVARGSARFGWLAGEPAQWAWVFGPCTTLEC
jgi:hypothetical protein